MSLKQFDLNGDGYIDSFELQEVAARFGAKKGQASYKRRLDFDDDGTIGQLEINIIAAMFGTKIRDREDDD